MITRDSSKALCFVVNMIISKRKRVPWILSGVCWKTFSRCPCKQVPIIANVGVQSYDPLSLSFIVSKAHCRHCLGDMSRGLRMDSLVRWRHRSKNLFHTITRLISLISSLCGVGNLFFHPSEPHCLKRIEPAKVTAHEYMEHEC